MDSKVILNELKSVSSDLLSDRVTIRNKAAERLDAILTNSKKEISQLKSEELKNENSFIDLFNSMIHALVKHATRIEETRDTKIVQTMRNKNFIYRSVVDKFIDLNLDNKFLSKNSLINAFISCISNKCCVLHFGGLILNFLDRGLFKVTSYVEQLKVNEFSRILSYMFEIDGDYDDIFRLSLMRSIFHGVQLAIKHVQNCVDIIDHFSKIFNFAKASVLRGKDEVIKLYKLFVSELSEDYHFTICQQLQLILPLLCDFYETLLNSETKDSLFDSIHLSLCNIYPMIHVGDFNTFNIKLKSDWNLTLKKCFAIVKMEIADRSKSQYRRCSVHTSNTFAKMASLVVFICNWHLPTIPKFFEQESLPKIAKPADNLHKIINLLQPKGLEYNEHWLAVFAKLLSIENGVLNVTNHQPVVQIILQILNNFRNAYNFQHIRMCFHYLLQHEFHLITSNIVQHDFCNNLWHSVVDYIIIECFNNNEIIVEKELLLQDLIFRNKVTKVQCIAILNSYINNSLYKRNECLETMRQLLIYNSSFDKADPIIQRLIELNCDIHTKNIAKLVMHDFAPVQVELISNVNAIAVVTFLSENSYLKNTYDIENSQLLQKSKCLSYKYNRKLFCIAKKRSCYIKMENSRNQSTEHFRKSENCLIKSNYELLMRMVDFTPSNETNCEHVLKDLLSLYHMVTLMDALIEYNIFDVHNCELCPLMKRIGFYLSHLELQMRSNIPKEIQFSNASRILDRLGTIFKIFITNPILLTYLESQPLKETIQFIGKALEHSSSQNLEEFNNWYGITCRSLTSLATLCATNNYYSDVIEHIFNHKFDIKIDVDVILDVIEIFCSQKQIRFDVANWFVRNLKDIFRLNYTKIDLISRIANLIPAIFSYVQQFEDLLDNMVIALASLIKVAYKKSYPNHIAAKLINCVQGIVRSCNSIFEHNDFATICYSIVKFLPFPSLEIQFATVETLTALMDAAEVLGSSSQSYLTFCENIYTHLKNENWTSITTDLEDNRKSVITQLLIALFMFSSYHKRLALEDLTRFCYENRLNEGNLFILREAATYFNSTLQRMMQVYKSKLIEYWMESSLPFFKFPYYVCCDTLNEFLQDNIQIVAASLMIYRHADDFMQDLEDKSKISRNNIIKCALPILYAYMLPQLAGCEEANLSIYKVNMQKLELNLKVNKISLEEHYPLSSINWETIYQLIKNIRDVQLLRTKVGSPVFNTETKWFHLSFNSFKKSLEYYLSTQKHFDEKESYSKNLSSIIVTDPLKFISLLDALKYDSYASLFSVDRLDYIFMYSVISEIINDALLKSYKLGVNVNCAQFFARDHIFFIFQALQNVNDLKLQHALLIMLHDLLNESFIVSEHGSAILKLKLNEICRSLILLVENGKATNYMESLVLQILGKVFQNENVLRGAILSLDELPPNPAFSEIRKIQEKLQFDGRPQQPSDNKSYFFTSIQTFLKRKNHSAEELQRIHRLLSKDKHLLLFDSNLLYELIYILIMIVREEKSEIINYEAAKCLGAVGALKIDGTSFYFKAQIYDEYNFKMPPVKYFCYNMAIAIEKLLQVFNPMSRKLVCDVAQNLINSIVSKEIKEEYPFLNVFLLNNKTKIETLIKIENKIYSKIHWIDILKKTDSLDYQKWISSFMEKVFNMCNWNCFSELAKNDTYFAEVSFFPFIQLILEQKEHMENILSLLEYFFSEFQCMENMNKTGAVFNSHKIYLNKRVINKFLNICECIRIHNNWKLPINLLYVAKACNYCQAYFLSIIYIEMWAYHQKVENKSKNVLADKIFKETVIEAYKSIDCSDATSIFLDPLESRRNFLILNNNITDVFAESNTNDITDPSYTSILKRNGMFALLCSNPSISKSIDYEVCWRLSRWDIIVESHSNIDTLNDGEQEFEKHHFNALKFLNNREENSTFAAIHKARLCILYILKEISIECLQSVYKYLNWLQLLQQIEDFCQVQFNVHNKSNDVFEKWKIETELIYGNFEVKEKLLSHQIALFGTAGLRATRKIQEFYKINPVQSILLKCVKDCKKADRKLLAIRNLATLRNKPDLNTSVKLSALLEDAEISFETSKSDITTAILSYIQSSKEFTHSLERVRAYLINGKIMMETNTESFEYVLNKDFMISLQLLNKFEKHKNNLINKSPDFHNSKSFDDSIQRNRKKIYVTIAKYADEEYTRLNSLVNSFEFKSKEKIIEQKQKVGVSGTLIRDRDKRLGATFIKKFADLDEKDIKLVEDNRTENLCCAVEHYILYCQIDESPSSQYIFRILALWFANKHNEKLLSKLSDYIQNIPSYKFVCALNQMTARLNSKTENFIHLLKKILIRCINDHTQQTLYQLMPLVFAFNDCKDLNDCSDDRVNIAREIIEKATNTLNRKCINQMMMMFPVLIDFGNKEIKETRNSVVSISEKLKKLINLDAVQCPTLHLEAKSNSAYNIISVVKWDNNAVMVGGINAPKKIVCLCSDGIKRQQLIKGKDDLRQDAIMQQVFSAINNLLKNKHETVKQKLLLRTYKILPLSIRSGIIEWCDNTLPIGTYLTGYISDNGAHKKYRPTDYTVSKCRNLAMQQLKSDNKKRLEIYLHICENIKPVFHYFFYENFFIPGIWFERRLAYINSVATTSIVGFILGLGDRHTQNILIDELTGEVVHIDFGIAFEQGKIMPTPETVPFRLTRDMVAPMGVCETNGFFKKSCESTMRILRNNQGVIRTILEVLLYDPHYIWKVASEIIKTDNGQYDEKNLMAQRALYCVQNKLEGKDTDILCCSDVEVQVQRLINGAMSAQNLSKLYPGWDPYL